jgi:hypothetical protein
VPRRRASTATATPDASGSSTAATPASSSAGSQIDRRGHLECSSLTPSPNDRFGQAIALNDRNGDGFADLAIGVDALGRQWPRTGGVHLINCNASGPIFTTDAAGHPGLVRLRRSGSEDFDRFGRALAGGDFDADGFGDLAIGVPHEDFGTEGSETVDAGVVHILYGSPVSQTSGGTAYLSKSTSGVPGDPTESDQMGTSLVAADFDGDGYDDLAIGVPGERTVPGSFVGAVTVVRGGAEGMTTAHSSSWNLDKPGIPGTASPSDFFGWRLGAGDFDGDGHADLAIGAPKDEAAGMPADSGTALVLYGTLFSDSFEGGSTGEWSAALP